MYRAASMKNQIAQDKKQNRDRDHGTYSRHGQHHVAHNLPPAHARVHAFSIPLPRRDVSKINKRANPFRIKVSRKSTSPSSTSDCKYKSPVASVNWLAITEAMESPGDSNEELMTGVLPITMVTAMVSPSARASARNTEPKMPARA